MCKQILCITALELLLKSSRSLLHNAVVESVRFALFETQKFVQYLKKINIIYRITSKKNRVEKNLKKQISSWQSAYHTVIPSIWRKQDGTKFGHNILNKKILKNLSF